MSNWTRAGAVVMFIGVAAGAFGAHGLKRILSEEMRGVFDTGVRYQLIHGLALFVVAWLAERGAPRAALAGYCFLGGIWFFSGSLYVLAITGVRQWGALTPIGGLLFLAGWLLVAAA